MDLNAVGLANLSPSTVGNGQDVFLALWPRVFISLAHILASRQEQTERSHPTRKNASSADTAPGFRRIISPSQSPRRDTELAHHTDAEGMAQSGEHRQFSRADEQADGTRWNQLELLTTICAAFSMNKRIETDASSASD